MNERMPSRIQSSRKFLLLLSYFSIVKKNNNKGKKKMINYSFYAHLQTPVSQGKGRSRVQPWSNDGQNSNSGVTLGTPQRWKGPTYSTGQPCPPISAAPPLAAPDSEEGWDPSGQRSDCWFPERHDHHGHHRHLPWDSQARGQVPRVNSHPLPSNQPWDKSGARTGWSIPPHHVREAGTGEAWARPAVPGAWAAAVRISGSPGGEAPVIPSSPLKI